MGRGQSLGRGFGWLWAAYAASVAGTMLAFDAFPIVAIRVLHASAAQVALLAAAGLAAGAVIAMPLGPWVEFRRKRRVMIGMDLTRFLALLTVPAAYALGRLSFAQLVAVSVIAAAADVAFRAASGACLKGLVQPEHLIRANVRLESTSWMATAIGPPLGGAAIGIFGSVTTVLANAVSFLLSALGIRAIGGGEPRPARGGPGSFRWSDLLEGWRFVLGHPRLRLLLACNTLVGGLILATAPLLAVLLLRDLGFAPWQYGLAFGVPCLGALAGARLARPLAARFGQHRVLLATGTLRACWPVGLAAVPPGPAGLVLVMLLQTGLMTCIGVFSPVFATYQLEQTPDGRVARVLAAWSITGSFLKAVLILGWGLLASVTGIRAAIALAGVLILLTPALLPRRAPDAPPPVPSSPAPSSPATRPVRETV